MNKVVTNATNLRDEKYDGYGHIVVTVHNTETDTYTTSTAEYWPGKSEAQAYAEAENDALNR